MHSTHMRIHTDVRIRKNTGTRKNRMGTVYGTALMIVVLALAVFPVQAMEEHVIQFRSTEDSSVPPDPAVCAVAPFNASIKLGASLWSYEARASDGLIVNNQVQRIGNATACTRINSLMPFTASPFYVKFTMDNGNEYTGLGTCTIISNSVPVERVIMAGCNLNLTGAPQDVLGGAATSMSIFNPFGIPGFNTGSYWTLRFFAG